MKTILAVVFTAFLALAPTKSVYDFTMKDIDGKDVSLGQYKGHVILIVNVASLCGNTPQYSDIEAMYEKYKGKGLVVLGFPANNFMGQEPGDDKEIKQFCTSKYAVTFPMFSKISVKGSDIAPLYSYLTEKKENGVIDAPVKWNFQKFLIGKDGNVITSFDPKKKVTDPEVTSAVEAALNK
jgi:glutathione peroxidase